MITYFVIMGLFFAVFCSVLGFMQRDKGDLFKIVINTMLCLFLAVIWPLLIIIIPLMLVIFIGFGIYLLFSSIKTNIISKVHE